MSSKRSHILNKPAAESKILVKVNSPNEFTRVYKMDKVLLIDIIDKACYLHVTST